MSGRAGHRKRLICVNAANIKHGHLYLTGHTDFFPTDCFGESSQKKGCGRSLRLDVAGISDPVFTDIPTDAKSGRPRSFFRNRTWVKAFFRAHGVRAGDVVSIERIGARHYKVELHRPEQEFSAAEFFAGIGLVRLALERHAWSVVFANDIDREKLEMYQANFGCDHFILGDIHKLDANQIPRCDLFTASFPCNDLSIAGSWEGLSGKQSSAFWGFIDILEKLGRRRPPIVLLENVIGFLQSHGGKDFESALLALNSLGYAVDAFILNAAHWTPQSRRRLFVVAKPFIGEMAGLGLATEVRPPQLQRFIHSHRNIRWDIADLPALPRPESRLSKVVEELPDSDPRWWDRERAAYFFDQLSDRHLVEARRLIRGKSYTYATAFRRVRYGRSMAELRTDGIAGCLRTPRGGSGRQILFRAGRGKYAVRLLTPRECARLQGAPDSFIINTSPNKALFGFGDAVCVPAIEWIAKHYLTPLAQSLRSMKPKERLLA